MTEQENFGYRSWKNVGPKSAEVMKLLRLALVQRHSTILMELHANSTEFTISISTNKKKCFGKCLSKQICADIQLPVLLIPLKDAMLKLLKSLVYVISIHTLCFRPDLFNFKKEEKILDICCNLEILGETKNGLDRGVITAVLGQLTNMPISS